MKIRTDFVTNSSSSSFIVSAWTALFPAVGAGMGMLASSLGGSPVDPGPDDWGAADPEPDPPAPAPGGQILDGQSALDWLSAQGYLNPDNTLSDAFWNNWWASSAQEGGLHGIVGQFSPDQRNVPIDNIAIIVDGGGPAPDLSLEPEPAPAPVDGDGFEPEPDAEPSDPDRRGTGQTPDQDQGVDLDDGSDDQTGDPDSGQDRPDTDDRGDQPDKDTVSLDDLLSALSPLGDQIDLDILLDTISRIEPRAINGAISPTVDQAQEGAGMLSSLWDTVVGGAEFAEGLLPSKETAGYIKDIFTGYLDVLEHEIKATMTPFAQSIGNALWYFDVINDTMSNYAAGDSFIDSLLKSTGVNYATYGLTKTSAMPAVAVYELLNKIFLGGSQAGEIASHVNTFKQGLGMLYDKAWDLVNGTDVAGQRLDSGAYGKNLQNVHHATEIMSEWATNEGQMAQDIADVVTQDEFYTDMLDTNKELWKPAEGSWWPKRGVLWLGEKATEGLIRIAEGTKDAAQYVGDKSTSWF